MIKTEDPFDKAISLPVEKRTLLVDKLLQNLNPTRAEIDVLWTKEAEKRVEEIKTGEVKTVPGDQVSGKIRDGLAQGFGSVPLQKAMEN